MSPCHPCDQLGPRAPGRHGASEDPCGLQIRCRQPYPSAGVDLEGDPHSLELLVGGVAPTASHIRSWCHKQFLSRPGKILTYVLSRGCHFSWLHISIWKKPSIEKHCGISTPLQGKRYIWLVSLGEVLVSSLCLDHLAQRVGTIQPSLPCHKWSVPSGRPGVLPGTRWASESKAGLKCYKLRIQNQIL